MTMSCDDAGSSGVRRFEVFTGAGKRRDWPLEVKASIVAESYSGKLSVSAVASRHGISAFQLFTCRRLLPKEMDERGIAACPVSRGSHVRTSSSRRARAIASDCGEQAGILTEALIAQVLVSKYADHLPLYRQAQIYARQGIQLDRSTLADWVGRAAWYLPPLRDQSRGDQNEVRGLAADERRDARDQRSRPIFDDLYRFLEARGRQVSAKAKLCEAISYALKR